MVRRLVLLLLIESQDVVLHILLVVGFIERDDKRFVRKVSLQFALVNLFQDATEIGHSLGGDILTSHVVQTVDMEMVHGRFSTAWVAVALLEPSAHVLRGHAGSDDAAFDLDKLGPEHRAVADGLLEAADALDPGMDVDTIAVVPVLEFRNQLFEIGFHIFEQNAQDQERVLCVWLNPFDVLALPIVQDCEAATRS